MVLNSNRKAPKSSRRKPIQDRSRLLVDSVLEAAAQVLDEYGFDGATTARIAERAGVSVGSIYQYFGTKNALFDALAARLIERLLLAALPALDASDRTFEDRIELAFRRGFEVVSRYPTILRKLAVATETSFESRFAVARVTATGFAAEVLTAHRESLGVTDPHFAARLLVDVAEGIVFNLRRDDVGDRVAREGARLIVRYCAP